MAGAVAEDPTTMANSAEADIALSSKRTDTFCTARLVELDLEVLWPSSSPWPSPVGSESAEYTKGLRGDIAEWRSVPRGSGVSHVEVDAERPAHDAEQRNSGLGERDPHEARG